MRNARGCVPWWLLLPGAARPSVGVSPGKIHLGPITPFAGGDPMNQAEDAALSNYPHGRGYGHDYMRGGEVLGGYGYAERSEYEKPRGEADSKNSKAKEVRQELH